MVNLLNIFLAQWCMSVGKSGHKRVKGAALSNNLPTGLH